jgi:hypothetical protein
MKTLEAGDMLDVIHTYYEESAIPMYDGHQKVLSDVRTALWKHIYEKEYPYPWVDPDAPKDFSEVGSNSDMMDPEFESKPYIPPTDPSEFGDILDGPLGG